MVLISPGKQDNLELKIFGSKNKVKILFVIMKIFKECINEVLPIPQREIDASQGRLSQNNGY